VISFPYVPELLPYDARQLETGVLELDESKRLLDLQGPLPRAWAGRLRRDLDVEAVAASTRMEGVNVTVEEVRRILAGESPTEVDPEDRELVTGYRNAMSFVLRQADDPAFAWDRGLIVGLHDRAMAGRFSLGAGRVRTDAPVFIVNRLTGKQVFLPPPGEEVDGLLDLATERMRAGHSHPALAAAWIHVAVAAIHPFRDGNGRAARILASLAMYRGGFKRPEFTSLEEWWGRHLEAYYGLFDCLGIEFAADADVTPFLVGHVDAQLHQVRALDIRVRTERQIWTAVEEAAEDAHLDHRIANALWDAFFGRDVTAGYYRALADVSPATVTNDLAAAVASGLLRAKGERRGRRYLAGERLYSAVARTLSIPNIGADETARDVIVSEIVRRLTEAGTAAPLQATHQLRSNG
jgi:Fic family protein